jgi:nicotinamidase-related amidase
MADRTPSSGENIQPGRAALILLDVITDFDFEDGDALLRRMIPVAKKVSRLKERAKAAGVPVIYVNDNFGKWQEDFKTMAEEFMRPEAKGQAVVEILKPEPDDYYVLKPHRSAFYSTTLELLLRDLKAKLLIITGVTTDICVLFTANDAYMRGFELRIPTDCVAAVKPEYSKQALQFISRVLKADVRSSDKIRFRKSARKK